MDDSCGNVTRRPSNDIKWHRGIDAIITKVTLILRWFSNKDYNKDYVNHLVYSLQIVVCFCALYLPLCRSQSLILFLSSYFPLLPFSLSHSPSPSTIPPSFLPMSSPLSSLLTLLFFPVNKRILIIYRTRIICYDDERHKNLARGRVLQI